VVIATKLDKVPRPQRQKLLKEIAPNGLRAVGFSTELPETTELVWRSLRAAMV
jgi:hypothetical protein